MTITYLNLYTAKQLMRLKSSTGLMSFVTTTWNGTPIMVTWNILASDIMQIWGNKDIWGNDVVEDGDKPFLVDIIKDFLKEN